MKLPLSKLRPGRHHGSAALRGDDTLGRGMEMALVIVLFLVLGVVLDNWLGTAPLFTIGLIALGAIGSFAQLRYAYEQRMEQLEAERAAVMANKVSANKVGKVSR